MITFLLSLVPVSAFGIAGFLIVSKARAASQGFRF